MPYRSIVIIGAGRSGMSAALGLQDKGIAVFSPPPCRGHGDEKTTLVWR